MRGPKPDPMDSETIAAIATGHAAGGIGIVRISGAHAGRIATALLGRDPTPRHAHLCAFCESDGELIDRGLLLWFPAPHSYTGEPSVELHGHGSPTVLRMLLGRVLQMGARLARPGEFSERAFLNGKLDLVQAEAVADLIASGSEAAARAAIRSLEGEFSHQVRALVDAVVAVRVFIEAAIDFPEEEIDFLADPQLEQNLLALGRQHAQLLRTSQRGVRLTDGLHVVIAGRPNVGKSSLLNAMAADERAIVTDIAGTTRDVLREHIVMDGVGMTLVDTAGLRDAGDAVEREGIRRARAELVGADAIMLVTDQDDAAAELERFPEAQPRDGRVTLVVHNKIDLRADPARVERHAGLVRIWLSAQYGTGLDLLRAELLQLAGHEDAEGGFSARARHVDALQRAGDHLHAAHHALHTLRAGELAAEELRQVQHALGTITGEFSSDDLLGEIFGSFCIGK